MFTRNRTLSLILLAFVGNTIAVPQRYPLRQTTAPVFDLPQAVIETNADRTVVRIPLAGDEALWGFGERFDALNQRGRVVESWLVDAWGGGGRSYFAVPFFISSAGYGLFVNNTGKVRFDCGVTTTNELRIEIPGGSAELFLFRGQPREILTAYTRLVGRPEKMPAWIFTPWISRNSYLSAYDVDRVIDQMRRHGLRAGVVVLEAWAESLQNFRFEPHRYPQAKEWIDRLHRRGYRVVCWETPSLWDSASTYPDAKRNGYLVLNPDGTELRVNWLENAVKVDFRKPAARQWWTKLHQPLVAMGVDGFKTDGGERNPDEWFHNLHPYYYQRAVLDAFKAQGRPGITFARSASPPCAGNAAFWAGDQRSDWAALPAVVNAGLSAAMSGFTFWGHDIGGYSGTPEKKLYLRWLELGAFSPIMQWHGTTPREPWYYDDETVAVAKFYLDLRWAMLPYLRTTAQEAAPMWRPLLLEFPNDAQAREVDDEFMFGKDLLVAPVLTWLDERTIYLPAGNWQNVWTGERLTGPTRLDWVVPLGTIPVFARAGSQVARLFKGPPPAVSASVNRPAIRASWPVWPQVARADGYVDLGKAGETTGVLVSAAEQPAQLRLGSGDGMTVWLNDALVFDKQVHRSAECDEDLVPVRLRAGENRLRVKVTHPPGGIGPNGFYLRVVWP